MNSDRNCAVRLSPSALLLVSSLSSILFVQAQEPTEEDRRAFRAADTNKDGILQPAEFGAYVRTRLPEFSRLDALMRAVDSSGNGTIELPEFAKRLEALQRLNRPGAAAEETPPGRRAVGAARDYGVPDFRIRSIPDGALAPFRGTFAKYLSVFGVHVFATESTPDAKVLHAATVLAEYLDNDEDGTPDNAEVVEALVARDAHLLVTANETEHEKLDHEPWHREGFHAGISQFASETAPGAGRFDATLEEVLHLITQHGYANAYPRVFGLRRGTELAEALDLARGGHFVNVPGEYPERAWFTYDDESCDYGCQATEYLYWAVTSLLGAQSGDARRAEIADEWRLPTADLVRERDVRIHGLITDPRYRFPTRLPDGVYRESGPLEFRPRRVVRPFPPIKDFPVKTVAQVGDRLLPNELVLGVEIDGESRAYPINMLTGPQREILNDTLAGHAIAATW